MMRGTLRIAIGAVGIAASVAMVVGVAPASAAPSGTTVVVDASKPGRLIPKDFVGLSFEADQMHRDWTDPQHGNVAQLLRNLGAGNMRFSANAVDNTAWMPDPSKPTPSWATDGQRVEPVDLSRVGDLARATGWTVDLGVNLAHFDPARAANQAAAAKARIGSSLRSLQIGNEPNVFALSQLQGSPREIYTAESYVPAIAKYRKAINAVAPGVQIDGPDTAGGAVGIPAFDNAAWPQLLEGWLDVYLKAFASQSRFLNQHYYPFVNVAKVGVPEGALDSVGALPTVDRLLSPATTAKQVTFLKQISAKARSFGLKPILSETNSVALEGREGVTNSFGGALWTVDYLMTAAREGITGVNLHNHPDQCGSYPLFCFPNDAAKKSAMAVVNPNYYAALMVSQVSGGKILPTSTKGRGHVTAQAVQMPNGQAHVVVDNMDKGFRGKVTVKVIGADTSSARVQQLTGPSIYATSGTQLAGSTVTPQGTFASSAGTPITKGAGGYAVNFAKPGAALMTVG